MPAGSSRGWFGCSRVESLPWSPTVVLNRVTTRILRATRIRSCTRINLLTAATISGVKPCRDRSQHLARRGIGEQPIAKISYGKRR